MLIGGVILKISESGFNNSTLDFFGGNSVSGALGDEGLTEGLGGEGDGCSEVVPFLSGKGVDSSLLGALLTTTSLQTRILTLSHFYFCSFFVLCFIIFNF